MWLDEEYTDSAGAGLSQVKRRACIHLPKQPKSMFCTRKVKSQSPDKLSLKKKKRKKTHQNQWSCFSFSSRGNLIKSNYITEMRNKQSLIVI